ncbi:ParB/RepB/Spo0J family partition protein [Achromobacter sp. SD115]|nr:ParB/RepB/Spo0J family partition protein [uncultured Achromobacter sp.]MBO1017273.1 ParB/RepB/Spo0J family partition protein [Achromobacter sp. SD115]
MMDLKGLGDLASMLDDPKQEGGFKMYDVARIHLDARNVRRAGNPGLTKESIAEMASTIRERVAAGKRGVLCPISLRPHPTIPGDFIINHGHRRYLGTREVGLDQIPAHEDPDFDDFDQVTENLHHEGLTGREMADFIGGKLAEGMTQSDIALKMGKSKAWVSMHVAMLNLPELVAEAVANGQITDVTVAKELVIAYREDPQAVEDLLNAPEQKPTRAAVKAIRQGNKPKEQSVEPKGPTQSEDPVDDRQAGQKAEQGATLNSDADTTSTRFKRELPDEVKDEFQRRRDVLDQEQRDAANPALRRAGMDALNRLIEIALRDTGQSKRVADFLLAWWNATSCGGFDLADLWSVDKEIYDDMSSVIALVRRSRSYPDTLTTPVHEAFKELVKIWRPQLVNE